MSSQSKNEITRQRRSPEEKPGLSGDISKIMWLWRIWPKNQGLLRLRSVNGLTPLSRVSRKRFPESPGKRPENIGRTCPKRTSGSRQPEEVGSDLSTAVLRLKKSWGPLGKPHGSTEVSQDVVQPWQFLKEKARFPLRHAPPVDRSLRADLFPVASDPGERCAYRSNAALVS